MNAWEKDCMKTLILKDILDQIKGIIIRGSDHILIQKVVMNVYGITHNTLYFNYQGYLNPSFLSKFKEVCVVIDPNSPIQQYPPNVTLIQVPHVNTACWNFISYYRSLFQIPVIGVTGTCGKTTTKEMITCILSKKMKVQSTYKSQNILALNLHYLIEFDDDTQASVIEMGVTHPGNITITSSYFKPTIGVITNIGTDHLEGCKTPEGYLKAKAEILAGLGNKGTLIINDDDENIKKLDFTHYKGNIISFGINKNADFRILHIQQGVKGTKFSIKHRQKSYNIHIPVHGEYNAFNAAAALAVSSTIGLDINESIDALLSFTPVERHFEIIKGMKGSTIIDDTWNTNPTSTMASIDSMKTLAKGKKKIVVLGSIALLGDYGKEQHYKIGQKVALSKIDTLIILQSIQKNVLDYSHDLKTGALENGMDETKLQICKNFDEIFGILQKIGLEDSVILLKSSMYQPLKDLIAKLVFS